MTDRHRCSQQRSFPVRLFCACMVLLLCSPLSAIHPASEAAASGMRLRPVRLDGVAYVSLQDLAAAVSGRLRVHPLKKKLELRVGGHAVVLTLLSPVAVIDDVAYRMPREARLWDGVLHVPAGPFVDLLAQVFPVPIELQAPSEPETAPVQPSFPPAPGSAAALEASARTRPPKPLTRTDWTLQTVVIDPGHGGVDPGAVGPGGTKEKDVVLRVAKRLKPLLEKRLRLNVVLTRKEDIFIPLRKRSQIAMGHNGGKLFLSLHCNADKKRRVKGAEVYFLSEAKTAAAAEVARRENAALDLERNGSENGGVDPDAELLRIQHSLLSTAFLQESQELASLIRTEIAQTMPRLDDRGVKQANFYVMLGTMGDMPSVLVEMGFISNPSEEKQLRSTAFQKKMAEAIYRSIRTFKLRYEQQLSTARK